MTMLYDVVVEKFRQDYEMVARNWERYMAEGAGLEEVEVIEKRTNVGMSSFLAGFATSMMESAGEMRPPHGVLRKTANGGPTTERFGPRSDHYGGSALDFSAAPGTDFSKWLDGIVEVRIIGPYKGGDLLAYVLRGTPSRTRRLRKTDVGAGDARRPGVEVEWVDYAPGWETRSGTFKLSEPRLVDYVLRGGPHPDAAGRAMRAWMEAQNAKREAARRDALLHGQVFIGADGERIDPDLVTPVYGGEPVVMPGSYEMDFDAATSHEYLLYSTPFPLDYILHGAGELEPGPVWEVRHVWPETTAPSH